MSSSLTFRRHYVAPGRAPEVGIGAAALGLVIVAAALATRGYFPHVLVALATAGAIALGLRSWRASLYGAMLYLPVSGIFTLALYPNTQPGVLAKDILFIVPAYAGFLVAIVVRRERLSFPQAPLAAFAMLGLLAVIQMFNPRSPSLLVGAIGLKVYLFYVPLVWLGYHLIREEKDLWRAFAIIALGALLPGVVGIAEAVMVATGQGETISGLYGPAFGAATQEFAGFALGGDSSLTRIPSTFSYWVQYWMYCVVAVAAAYGWMRGGLKHSVHRWLGLACIAIAAVGGLTSGSRAAFIFIPLLLITIAVLDGWRPSRTIFIAVSSMGLVPVAVFLLGVPLAPLYELISGQAKVVIDLFAESVQATARYGAFGNGTGVNTGAALRYGSGTAVYLGGYWYQSWWIKVSLELGVPGLICLLIALWRLVASSVRAHRVLRHARFRSASAVMLAVVFFNLVYAFKSQYIDLDPMNVYFWLFLGMLAALPALDRNNGRRAGEAEERNRQ